MRLNIYPFGLTKIRVRRLEGPGLVSILKKYRVGKEHVENTDENGLWYTELEVPTRTLPKLLQELSISHTVTIGTTETGTLRITVRNAYSGAPVRVRVSFSEKIKPETIGIIDRYKCGEKREDAWCVDFNVSDLDLEPLLNRIGNDVLSVCMVKDQLNVRLKSF